MRRGVAPLALALVGCSLAPFDPVVVGDGGRLPDAGRVDGGGVDSGRADAGVRDGGPGAEDCTNGSDDDGDGQVDCADSDCGTFSCVPAPPAGWMGPVFPSSTDCAALSAETVAQGGEGLRADPVACGACTCGSPSGATCSATVRVRPQVDCGGTTDTLSLTDGTCVAGSGVSVSYVDADPEATCAVTSASPPAIVDAPAPTYDEPLWLCRGGGGGGCAAGMVCAATPGGAAALCAVHSGDVECPSELPSRRVMVTSTDDGRSCTACRCVPGGTCGGTLAAYGAGCGTVVQTLGTATSSTCVNLSGTASAFRYDATISGATCNPAGGAGAGCVAPAEVSTLCCPASAGPVCPAGRGPAMLHVDAPSGGRGYCIDTTEVTNAQYAVFLASSPSTADQAAPCDTMNTDFTPSGSWPRPEDQSERPVVSVDWCDARAFCAWAGKRLCALTDGTAMGDEGDERDTTRSEWAHACSAGDPLDCAQDGAGASVEAVRSHPCCQSNGVHDLPGNADEWTGTCDDEGFLTGCVTHDDTRCDSTRSRSRTTRDSDLGFRCCADPT